jgi:excisionase family DNA binding protein
MTIMESRPLISIREAAAQIGVTESTGYRWLARGELPGAVRVGGRWYVRQRVLANWLDGTSLPADDGRMQAA